MATPDADGEAVPVPGDARIDGLVQGGRWGSGTGGQTLTYAFEKEGGLDIEWSDALMDAVTQAFLAWLASEEAALAYARASGAPALAPEVAAKIAGERPDLVKLGEFAGAYGFVMTGATSANALAVYELQA